MADRRLLARVKGRVQGVGFRFFAEGRASELGLSGWVRNLPDGSVELVAEGPEADLGRLVEALESGPPHSHVDAVETRWGQAAGEHGAFRIRR